MSKTITWTAALLGSMALAGCSGPKTLYQWEGYQAQVHEYFKGESKEAQAQALEADLEKIRAKNGAVPMVREMVAAMGPIAVPTSHLVSGMSATMRMAYGIDLVMLTITADSTV